MTFSNLDVSTVRWHEVLVDVGACLPDPRLRRVHGATASNLPEQPLAPAT